MINKGKERAFDHARGNYDDKYTSYFNGYTQALQDIKANEMLDILERIDHGENVPSVLEVRKLIAEITESK